MKKQLILCEWLLKDETWADHRGQINEVIASKNRILAYLENHK